MKQFKKFAKIVRSHSTDKDVGVGGGQKVALHQQLPPVHNIQPSTNQTPKDIFRLVDLPLDILQYTTEFLSIESFVCLSLISKHFYRTFFSAANALLEREEGPASKRALLLLLETDTPWLLRCYTCNLLYDWKKVRPDQRKRKTPKDQKFAPYLCPRRQKNILGSNDQHLGSTEMCGAHLPCRMEREEVDLILRYALLGPDYGLPPSRLEHTCQGQIHMAEATRLSMRFVPKIKDGKLVLWSSYRLAVFLRSSVLSQVNRLNRIVCRHVSGNLPAVALCVIAHLLQHKEEPRYETPKDKNCQKLQKCALCHSDIQVTATFQNRDIIIIRVDAFQNFGGRVAHLNGALKEMFNSGEFGPMNVVEALTRNLEEVYFSDQTLETVDTSQKLPKPAMDKPHHSNSLFDGRRQAQIPSTTTNHDPQPTAPPLINGGFGTVDIPGDQPPVETPGSCLIQEWRCDSMQWDSDFNTFPDNDAGQWLTRENPPGLQQLRSTEPARFLGHH